MRPDRCATGLLSSENLIDADWQLFEEMKCEKNRYDDLERHPGIVECVGYRGNRR